MNDQPLIFDPNKQYWGCNVDPHGEIHVFCGVMSAFMSAINLYYLEWYFVTDKEKIRMCDHTHHLFDTKEECCLFIYNQEMKKLDAEIEKILQQRFELSKQLNERLSTAI